MVGAGRSWGAASARSRLPWLCVSLAVVLPLLALAAAPASASEPPVVTTRAWSWVTPTSAELQGTVTSSAPATDCHYEYGTTSSYGLSAPCWVLPGAGTTVVGGEISGLTPETTYHYRLSVTTEGGTGVGGDRTVKTVLRPEYGTCVKVTTGTGLYATATCISEGGEKKYEWYPAFESAKPLVKRHFLLQIQPATKAFLYSYLQPSISCTGAAGSGEYTGNQTIGAVTLTLSGCQLVEGGSSCTSSGALEGHIALSELTGTLGVLKETNLGEPGKAVVGTDLKPASGEVWASFSCAGQAVTVSRGVIGEVKRNSMTTNNFIKYAASTKAAQKWKEFVRPHGVERLFSEWPAQTWSALSLSLVLTSEEKVEVNSVL